MSFLFLSLLVSRILRKGREERTANRGNLLRELLGFPALREFSFPRLIVVPLSSHEIDGVRKEKERLTAASISSGK